MSLRSQRDSGVWCRFFIITRCPWHNICRSTVCKRFSSWRWCERSQSETLQICCPSVWTFRLGILGVRKRYMKLLSTSLICPLTSYMFLGHCCSCLSLWRHSTNMKLELGWVGIYTLGSVLGCVPTCTKQQKRPIPVNGFDDEGNSREANGCGCPPSDREGPASHASQEVEGGCADAVNGETGNNHRSQGLPHERIHYSHCNPCGLPFFMRLWWARSREQRKKILQTQRYQDFSIPFSLSTFSLQNIKVLFDKPGF